MIALIAAQICCFNFKGKVFFLGGGAEQSMKLWELVSHVQCKLGKFTCAVLLHRRLSSQICSAVLFTYSRIKQEDESFALRIRGNARTSNMTLN